MNESRSSLKAESGEGKGPSGGRGQVGASVAAGRHQAEAGGARAADPGATEARGGEREEGAAAEVEERGERKGQCKVTGKDKSFTCSVLIFYFYPPLTEKHKKQTPEVPVQNRHI